MIKASEVRFLSVIKKDKPEICYACKARANKEVLFQIEGAIAIRTYCDGCLPNAEY